MSDLRFNLEYVVRPRLIFSAIVERVISYRCREIGSVRPGIWNSWVARADDLPVWKRYRRFRDFDSAYRYVINSCVDWPGQFRGMASELES